MAQPWDEGVEGSQTLALINADASAPAIRVEAGPGTGKTFGLVHRVHRLLHPDGCGLSGGDVLVGAFNRVIARQLDEEIRAQITPSCGDNLPIVKTVHALSLLVQADRETGAPFSLIMRSGSNDRSHEAAKHAW